MTTHIRSFIYYRHIILTSGTSEGAVVGGRCVGTRDSTWDTSDRARWTSAHGDLAARVLWVSCQ